MTQSFFRIVIFVMVVLSATWILASLVETKMVEDGLVSYWPLDEIEGGKKIRDAAGENHGELQLGGGEIKIVAGKVGGAGQFDGVAAVHIPGTKTLAFNDAKEMTVSAWINAKTDEPVKGVVPGCCGTIVAQRDINGWALRFDGRNSGKEVEFICSPGWIGDGGFGFEKTKAGQWHYLTAVVDGANQLLYLDGKNQLKLARPDKIQTNGGTETEIGKAGDGGFVGLIDEVTIYNRALSQKEIQQNFEAKGMTAVNPIRKLATRWAEIKVLR